MKHWNTLVATIVTVVIFGGMMVANIDGLVYNVCTSDGPHGINSLKPPNISYTGVSIKVLSINPSGSLNVQVSSDKKIKDVILWAEFRENSKERHIGAFMPVIGHAYIDGCSGLTNATITNYGDFTNTSQVVYEWEPPLGAKVTLTSPGNDKKEPHQKHHHKEHCPGGKGGHHHKHKDHKKHHHKHEKHHCKHKDKKKHKCEKHHHKGNKKHHHPNNKKHHNQHPSSFTFKGVAFLENEPHIFYMFTLDKSIHIRGYDSSSNDTRKKVDSSLSNASPMTSSKPPTSDDSSIGVHVSAFDDTISAASNLGIISGRDMIGIMATSFLAGILLIL